MHTTIRLALGSLCLLVLATESALAYLDPGTGSLILQSVIAGIAGAIVAGRFYWDQCKSYFAARFSRSTSQPGVDTAIANNCEDNDSERP